MKRFLETGGLIGRCKEDLYPRVDILRSVYIFLPATKRSLDNISTKYVQLTADEQFVETAAFDHRQSK